MRFPTTIRRSGKTATVIPIPPKVLIGLKAGKRPAVIVTVRGISYRGTVASHRGEYMVPLNAERREAAGLSGGDRVTVDIQLDTAPREVQVPPDFRLALESNPLAMTAFDALPRGHQERWVAAVEDATNADMRERRIGTAVVELGSRR